MSHRRLFVIVGSVLLLILVAVVVIINRRPPVVVEKLPVTPLPALTPTPSPTPPPLPTAPPYTPVAGDVVAPIVVERSPARGEVLAPDAPLKLVFDRPMDQNAVAGALVVSPAVRGRFEWSDARTVLFRPEAPWTRNAQFDVVLNQGARGQDGAQLNGAYQFRFATTGYLEAAQVIPAPGTQDVQAVSPITVIFNRPVVALTTVEDQARLPQPLRVVVAGTNAPVAGRGEWLNTSIHVFHPERALQGGTTYTAVVDRNLHDTDGNPLQADYTWQFAVAEPQVVGITPETNARSVGVEPVLRVEFNQPVAAGATLELSAGQGNVPGTIGAENQTLIFTPTARLQFDTEYTATIPAGSGGLQEAYRWSFRTVPLPRIISTTPADGDQHADPHTAFSIRFNAPIDPTTVERNLRWTPAISATAVYTYYNEYEHTFHINFGAQPSSDYQVEIGPDIADPYGNKTGETRTVRFRTDPLDPSVRMLAPEQVGTYSAVLPTRLMLQSVNAPTARFSLYRVETSDLIQGSGRWYQSPPPASQRLRTWDVTLETPLNQSVLTPLDLVEGGGTLPPGAYLISLDSEKEDWQRYHMLVVSEINLTLKSGEREVLVWANRLSDGSPVADVPLTIYTGENTRLGTATTDANGVARLAFKPPTTSSRYAFADQPFAAVGDGWSNGIAPYELGISQTYGSPERVTALYTDRPIYRPGQTVRFKGVVREERDVRFFLPHKSFVDILVRNPEGQEIYKQQLRLNALGTFNGEIALADNAVLGQYIITDDKGVYQPFTVAAYRPPEFEVTVTTPMKELVRGTASSAQVDAKYFFGGPVAGVPVEWHVFAETHTFSPPNLGRYSFRSGDDPYMCYFCWWQPPQPPTPIMTGTATTDAQGQIRIDLPAELRWNDGQPITTSVRLAVEATATGKDNQVISGRSELVVHQAGVYVGLASRQYVSPARQETAVDVVTTDTGGNRRAGQVVEVVVERYTWLNRRVDDAFGGHWESAEQRTIVAQQTVTTDERGEAVVRFTPAEGGSYRLRALTSDGTRSGQGSLFLWITDSDYVPWQRSNDDRITLIANQNQYAPGDTAEILIPSPFTGPTWALVTIERGSILRHEVIALASNSTVYRLPITAAHAPNIYVSAVLFTGPSEGAPLADYKVGTLPLLVDTREQSLDITLTPQGGTTVEPGVTVQYDVDVKDKQGQPVAAELSLDLVDKAVLSLMPREADVLMQAFYSRRGLGIGTASGLAISADRLLDELIKRQEQTRDEQEQAYPSPGSLPESAGGGDMATTAGAAAPTAQRQDAYATAPPANVQLRSNVADTAFWEAVVTTDSSGKGTVEIPLPDNITTWVLRGVGLTEDTKVGAGTVEVVATKPLLVRPVTPRFFVVGDRVELSANVSNNSDQDLPVDVALSATGITLTAPLTQTITIPARSEAQVKWSAEVGDAQQTQLVFRATSGAFGDAATPRLGNGPEGTLPIYRYSVPETVGTGGEITAGGQRTEVIALPSSLDAIRGEVTLRLDPSLAAGMRDALDYLDVDPEDSTEYIISGLLPNVVTYQTLKTLGVANADLEARLPALIRGALEQLALRQHDDGGWGWWTEDESNPNVSAYAVLGLARTKAAGFTVDETMLQRALGYLEAQREPLTVDSDTSDANLQAFFMYVLGEAGNPVGDGATLQEYRAKLSSYGKALLVMAIAKQRADDPLIPTLLSELRTGAILSATGAHWEENMRDWWSMNTDTRSTAIVLQALTRVDPDNQLNPNVVRWLMVARKDGIWETTQESAWAVMALTDWMVHTGELQADYDYAAFLNDAERTRGHIGQADLQTPKTLRIEVAELLRDRGNRLTVARGAGPGVLYYTTHLRAFLPVDQVRALDRGIRVSRRYTLASCTAGAACPEVKEVKVGDVIRVDLTLVAPNDLYYLRVEDPLPAGAEAVDTGLATTSLLAQGPQFQRERTTEVEGGRGSGWDWGYWWNWYTRSELRDEKVVLWADFVGRGAYEYSYTMRATQPGAFNVIPTTANEVYFPEVYGRGDGQVLVVR